MPRSRGRVSRAASALLFCAAALAALVFPEGSAGGRGVGFAPGQVPFDLLLIPGEDAPGVDPDDPRFDGGELCGELGGTLRASDQEDVCGGIDRNDTFCIAGSAEAFPCRGLYKHVIVCNAGYNRPALNPFFCGAACASGQQARGANCERVVLPAEAATYSSPPATLYVAEGHSGAVAVAKAKAGVTLDFSPSAGSPFIVLPPPAAEGDSEGDYAVLFPPPGFGAGLDVSLTARIVCAGCYPSRLTVIASLLPVRAPAQPRIAAVFGEPFSAVPVLPAAPGDYAGATLTLASSLSGFSLESGTLTSSAGGGPDAGIYEATVGATHAGFAGTLALVISSEISRQPLPAAEWGLRAGDERAAATIAAGHPAAFHRAASRNGLASLVLPAPIAGLRTALEGGEAAFYADLRSGVLNTTAVLTVRHSSDASSGKRNYWDLAQTVAVWMSVVAEPERGSFQATASAEIAGVSLAAPDFAAGEFLDLDPADEFNIGADGVVSGTPTQDALYELAAGWTTEGMLGTLTLAFQMIVGEGKIINPDDVVAVRTVERTAAAGFSGAGWTVTAAAGYTLDFRGEENSGAGQTLRALAGGKWELGLTTALESEGRTVAARARALCGDCLAGQFVTVTAVFAAVLAPDQATLAGVYGEDGAAHELTPPTNYATGGTFAVVGVSGSGGNFVVDGTGAGLARDSSNTPNAGPHVVSVAMTHPGFLGSLTLEVTANIARKIPSDVAGLSPQGRTTVTAAFGHTGEVFQLTLANADYEFGRYDFSTINAGSVVARVKETDGIDDADRELTAAELLAKKKYLFGLTLAASADRLTLSAAPTAALAEGEALPPEDGTEFMLVYAQRRDGSPNFTDYGQFVFYRIDTLDEPPVAGLRRAGPLAAGTALFDFAAGSYANGDYARAVFSELGGAGALDAAAGGAVTVAGELTEPGYYAITVLAASPDGAGFVGTARLTLSLTLSRVIDLDAAVWPRVIVTAAARGFYGPGVSFAVNEGYVVENPNHDFSSGPFDYDESSQTFIIRADSPLGASAVTAAVTANVRCESEGDLCDVRAVTVTAIFNPVEDPGQGTVTAFYGESFGQAARPPAGYESGGRFALLGVGGVDAAALSAISLRVGSSGGLTLDVAGGVGGALSAGIATATIGMTHPDFLGTVALRTRLEILPADPGPLYALSAAERNPGVVTVAAEWRGVAHQAQLGAGAAGGGIVLPQESPRNVSLALSGDGRTVSFALSSQLEGGAAFAETIALTVTRNDLNYYDLGQTVELRVSALAAPAAVNQDGAGSPAQPFRSGNLHDFGRGIYADAVFGKKSGSDELQVSADGVVSVISAGIAAPGIYGIVVTATSSAFLGAAEFEFTLQVGVLGGLPGSYAVPPTARTERRKVAAGYTGSVAFFAASTVGVTLRTPGSAPSGFDFSGAGLDFVSPEGFAVSLLSSPGAGKAATASFEAAASFRDYAETAIPLRVEVSVLESPAPQSGRAAVGRGETFSGGDLHDFGVGDYAGAVFGKQSGANELTVSESGVVSADNAGMGTYGIVMTATSAAFLGAAEFRYALEVEEVGPLPEGDGVPPGARTVTVTVAAGHTGSVAFFAAAVSGAVLRTPASAPAGFGFETETDFVSPNGFAVSLTAALAPGGARGGSFEVAASRAGFTETRITLSAAVSALAAAPLAEAGIKLAPFSGAVFDFADDGYADGIYDGARFSAGGELSADLEVEANGRVSAARSLSAGVYGVTVLAAGELPGYLGTATLSLRLTVGWRVEYGGSPAGGGEVTAADGSGSALASGAVAAPGAAVTFRATPSSGHYVSGWTGACGGASGPGQIGSAARPGEAWACGLTVSAHINVTANFAEGGEDVLMFNGAVVQATGQLVSVTLNNITVNSAANNLSVNMAYHGVLRNLHVMRLARWLIGASGITGGTGAFPGAHFRNVGIAAGVCGRDGWRVPTVGEIVGLSKSGAGPEIVGRVAGSPSDYNVAPAGAAVSLSVPLPPAGADDNAASLPDELYEFDSRDAGGAYAVVRYRSAANLLDISFAKSTANRKVICVKDPRNAADSPDLAAVRLESGGEIAGNPVATSANPSNPSPSFTVTATLSVSHSFGDGLFTGTVQAWKHKDAPVILSGSRPLVTAASGLATGYDVVTTAAAGGSGTEVMVKVGSPRPLAIAGLTTLSLRAAAELGVTANIEVVVDVLGGRQFEAHYAAESFRGGVRIGGLLATLRGGGAVAPGGRANRGEDLHVTATPEADYYVDSWTGACAGTGASSAGEAKTCVLANVQTASVTVGAIFGRDECAAAVSPCGENGACLSDPEPLAEGSMVECLCDSGFADDGSGFCAEINVGDLIAPAERAVVAYVSPTYSGSVAFFRAQDGATLRTPSSSPSGFSFATNTEFLAPAGVVVSMPLPLAEGGELTGVFTVTAEEQGVAREIVLQLTVRGLSRISRSWRGLSSDSGGLEVLTVSGFSGARFTALSSPAALSVSESGVISAPSGAGRGAAEHKLTVSGVAEHDDFLGRLPFVFAADVCTVVESPPVLSFDAGAQASLEIVTDSYARTGGAFLRFEACGLINRGANPHRALHRSARLAERGRALGLLLTLNADANLAVAGDETGAGEYGTPLDVAVYNGVLENAPALRRGGGGCVFQASAAECAAEHADYAGLAEVPADSIVAPASRSLTVTMGRLSPGKTAWGSFGVVARISTASPGPHPAQRVLLHPLPSDLARRFYHTDGVTGEGIEFFSIYPGAGETLRKRLTVQGVRNGMRPGKVTVEAVYAGLADISRSVNNTTPGANFYNLRTVSGLGGATFAPDNTALSTPGFSVASDGMVSGPASFSGAAAVFFLAKSDGFQGWAVGRLDVNPQTAAVDADSLIAERNPQITVLSGHAGDVYTLPTDALLARGYNLILGESASVFAGGGLRREWNRIYIPSDRPMAAGETRTAALTVGVDCAACAAGSKLTLTATFVPLVLSAGAQPEITAQVNYDFDVSLNLPSGYGAEEGSSTRTPFSSAAGLYFSASRKNGRLSRRLSGGGGVEQLPPGTRVVPVLLTNPGFVGALTLQVTVHSTARPLGDLGVPASQLRTTVLVAPGFSGALPSPAAADARVRARCEGGDYPGGFAVSSDCDLTLASGAGERGLTVTAVETLSEFYETRTLTLAVSVKEIAAPRVEIYRKEPFFGVPAIFSSNDYAEGIYRNAIFSEAASAHLISDEDGFVVTNGELLAGRYTLTVVADSSPDFLGAAALVVVVDVSPYENPGVSAARLDATVYAAAGYSGEIHRLVADDPRTELTCAAATVDNIELTTDCVFLLVGGSGTRRGIFDFSQTVPGAAAAALRATVEARELASPPEFVEDILTGSGAHRGEEDLLDLGGWAPAGLGGTFAEAFADARYTLIADDAGVVSLSVDGRMRLAGAPGPGDYGATIHAYSESGGLAGTVAFSALIRARERRAVLAADSIPPADRFIAARAPRIFIGVTLWRADPVDSDVVLTVVKQTLEGVVTEFADSFQTELPSNDVCKAMKGDDEVLLNQLAPSGSNRCMISGARAPTFGIQEKLVYKPADNAIVFTGADEKSFAFKVRATREPAREWEADEFLVHIRLASHPKVPAVNLAVDRVSAVGRALLTLFPSEFPGASVVEVSDGDNMFSVSSGGEVRLSGASAPSAGSHVLVVAATVAESRGFKRFYGRISMTANIAFVSAGGVVFAGGSAAAGGTVASVTLLDEHEREIVTVGAVYQGTRRGLHWMETSATLNKRDVFSGAYRGFAEQLCAAGGESGGKRWRVPTIGEVAGILTDGTGPAVLATSVHFREIPGAANGLRIPLPTAARGGGKNLTDNSFVVSAHEVNKGTPLPVLYELVDGKTKLGGNDAETVCPEKEGIPAGHMKVTCTTESFSTNCTQLCTPSGAGPRYACVLEAESFSPTPPLLGVRLEGDGRVLAGGAVSGVRGPEVPTAARTELSGIFSESGPVVTITASAWRNVLTDSSFRRAAARDQPDEPLMGAFSGSAGLTAEFSSSGGKTVVVVRLTETPTFALESRVFTLSFAPEFGATVSLAATVRSQAPAVSDEELAAALPPESRSRAFRAVPGYAGALLTLSSSDSRFTLTPPTGDLDDGFGIVARVGGNYVLTVSEISGPSDSRAATIGITVSVVGRNSRRTATLSFSVEPLSVPFREPVREPSDEVGGMTLAVLKAGDFASAVFERISGDAGLRVDAQSGAVVAEAREWTEGGYHVVVGARDAGRFFGMARITLSLVVGTVKPVLFLFNRAEVRESGEAVAVRDLLGGDETRADFSMVYRGVRRGLRWMESAAAGSSTHQRELCAAGGRRYGWRVPTASEVAGLLLSGETAEIGGSVPAENGAAVGARISLAAGATDALAGLSAGPFFSDFMLGGRAAAARAEGGKLHLSGAGAARYLCVSAGGGMKFPSGLPGFGRRPGAPRSWTAGCFLSATGGLARAKFIAFRFSPITRRFPGCATTARLRCERKFWEAGGIRRAMSPTRTRPGRGR